MAADHYFPGGDAVSVRRVSVHAQRRDGAFAVDVSLPSGIPVVDLMPAIVDLTGDGDPPGVDGTGWRLDRPGGTTLDESLSLHDNDVRDGELLVLSAARSDTMRPARCEPCRVVAAASPGRPERTPWLAPATCVLTTALAAIALAVTGMGDGHRGPNLVVAAAGTCAAVAVTIVRGGSIAPRVAAVLLGAATGGLAVPSGPSAANVFLAAAAALSVSLLIMRLSAHASSAMVATLVVSALIATVTVVAMPVGTAGALMATTSLGLLAASPRIAVLAAGLGPDHWADDLEDRATAGHTILTGLVAACSAGTAAGVALTAARYVGDPYAALAMTAAATTVLLLRARTYADPVRRISLVASGLTSAVGGLALTFDAYPGLVGWCCGALVAVGLAAEACPPAGDALSRLADRAEYVALAAVVPLACWAGGAYDLVTQVHLP